MAVGIPGILVSSENLLKQYRWCRSSVFLESVSVLYSKWVKLILENVCVSSLCHIWEWEKHIPKLQYQQLIIHSIT